MRIHLRSIGKDFCLQYYENGPPIWPPHTLVVNKDTKFIGLFQEVVDTLLINLHILSGVNHNAMLVKRINLFLNGRLRIFRNDCDNICVSTEAILFSVYAWNRAPVADTNISRSLVVLNCELSFPIDFYISKTNQFSSTSVAVKSYACQQAVLLKACCKSQKSLSTNTAHIIANT